jgi:S-adenosylmethionine synthetase
MQPTMTETSHGDKVWQLDGKFHRTDGPAYESGLTGRKTWWKYGERHRTDGPAV